MGALNGLLLLARFRAEGFGYFAATPQAFLNSLTPLLALTLVAAMRPLLAGAFRLVLLQLLTTAVALLTPAVLSHLLASVWKREAHWLRYAVAYNWCHAAVTLLMALAVLGASGGTAIRDGMLALAGLVLAYWIGVAWFLFRRGLDISGGKAVLAVLATHFGTGVLILLPHFLAAGLQ